MGGMNAIMRMMPTGMGMGMNGMQDMPSTQTLRQSPSGQRQNGWPRSRRRLLRRQSPAPAGLRCDLLG